jgi:site-specific DNA-methyltransferase (adenine-specific)
VPVGGTVLDPFCGSGTTLLEASLSGRKAIGVDLNPLALAISAAKIQNVSLEDVLHRVLELAREYPGAMDIGQVPDDLKIIFHPRTIAQLVYLKSVLDFIRPEDIFIRGAILGLMHGKVKKGGDSLYLSIDMPNTFSMSPDYVRKFVKENKLKLLPADVFGKLRMRVSHLLRGGSAAATPAAIVLGGDAAQLKMVLRSRGIDQVDAVITSPPYLGILRYGAFNWIRLWFLGLEPKQVDQALDGTDSLDRYLSFMGSFLISTASVLAPGKCVALVIGDVVEEDVHLELASRVWEEIQGTVPFRLVSIEEDRFDDTAKTTRIWGENKKGRATPLDRILTLERLPSIEPKRGQPKPGARSKSFASR